MFIVVWPVDFKSMDSTLTVLGMTHVMGFSFIWDYKDGFFKFMVLKGVDMEMN